MSPWKTIAGIAMFMVVTAVLYVWGLKKSFSQQENMVRALLHACGSKVLRYLKKHDTVSRDTIATLIEGTTVGPMWSRQRMRVQSGKDYAPQVIEFLFDQLYIQQDADGRFRRRP